MSTLLRSPSSRRRLGALAAALTALALVGQAAPASAAGATGRVDTENTTDGTNVRIDGKKLSTSLIPINLDDETTVQTYCIDFATAAKHNARMIEDDWAKYPNPNASFKAKPEKVNWILHNSYPNVAVEKLAEAGEIDRLTEKDAIAGTQLAIWHFSNDTRPDGSGNDDEVIAVYEYLTGEKNTGLTAEPAPSLAITPDSAAGAPGGKLGPFTVETTASEVVLKFEGEHGAALVDANGAPVTTASNGTKLFVAVPAGAPAGKATIEAKVSADIETGRLFRGDKVVTQTLITTTTTRVKVKDSVEATWTMPTPPTGTPSPSPSESTPSPTASPSPSKSATPSPSASPSETVAPTSVPTPGGGGGLPVTGAASGLIAGIGLLLLAGGGALFYFARRRKAA
jgi:TQXA domain-containing protein/LPXTG-motif cell wall-anchored protein